MPVSQDITILQILFDASRTELRNALRLLLPSTVFRFRRAPESLTRQLESVYVGVAAHEAACTSGFQQQRRPPPLQQHGFHEMEFRQLCVAISVAEDLFCQAGWPLTLTFQALDMRLALRPRHPVVYGGLLVLLFA